MQVSADDVEEGHGWAAAAQPLRFAPQRVRLLAGAAVILLQPNVIPLFLWYYSLVIARIVYISISPKASRSMSLRMTTHLGCESPDFSSTKRFGIFEIWIQDRRAPQRGLTVSIGQRPVRLCSFCFFFFFFTQDKS